MVTLEPVASYLHPHKIGGSEAPLICTGISLNTI
jgi:hypothetical protein